MTTLEKIENIDKWLAEYGATDIYDLIEKLIDGKNQVAINMYYDLIACWHDTARDNQHRILSNQELDSLILGNVLNKLEKWEKRLK